MHARTASRVGGLFVFFFFLSALAASLPLVSSRARAAPSGDRTVPVRTMGWHRGADGTIWVWRNNKLKFSTLTHELLHRVTRGVPRSVRRELATLTADPSFDEGLTSYFTQRALQATQHSVEYPCPRPGAPYADLRRWARQIRADAQQTLRTAFGVDVDTHHIMICSDGLFGRCYLRDFGQPWTTKPGQPGIYGNSKARVQQIVDLVGEQPVRRAYFQGDVAGLRTALQRARSQSPTTFPGWLRLE